MNTVNRPREGRHEVHQDRGDGLPGAGARAGFFAGRRGRQGRREEGRHSGRLGPGDQERLGGRPAPGTDKAKDKADAEAKKAKGEASAQKKKVEGDAQKAKDDAVKKTDKTVKGQQAGAKAKGSAAVEKAARETRPVNGIGMHLNASGAPAPGVFRGLTREARLRVGFTRRRLDNRPLPGRAHPRGSAPPGTTGRRLQADAAGRNERRRRS
ncbi:MAG: hypothetical protein MZV70_64420 [Desulfobacterales bacterium]|nr:hypothetical protein [Desulfobacterales bacterium]